MYFITTLKKALALREGPHPCAGHMEDDVAVQVPLLPSTDVKEEIAESEQITLRKPVVFRTAEQSADDLVQQGTDIPPFLPVKEKTSEIMHLIPQKPAKPQIVDILPLIRLSFHVSSMDVRIVYIIGPDAINVDNVFHAIVMDMSCHLSLHCTPTR